MERIIKLLASVLFSIFACSIFCSAYWVCKSWLPFCGSHPGIVLVALGFIGATIFDLKKSKTFKEKLKWWSEILLLIGLLLEIREAVKSDGQILALQSQHRALQAKIQPRTITPEQRHAFTNMPFVVLDSHEKPLSQLVGIKVILGLTDFETFSFAKQLSGFFCDIGLRTNEEIIQIPDFLIIRNPSSGFLPCDVICCYCSTNGEPYGEPIPGTSFMRLNAKGRAINDLCRVMNTMGFSTDIYDGKDLQKGGQKIMRPGEFAVFVPEKVPY